MPALDPRRYGFPLAAESVRADFVSEVLPPAAGATEVDTTGILDFPEGESGEKSIEEIVERLADVYCGGVGYEVRRASSGR